MGPKSIHTWYLSWPQFGDKMPAFKGLVQNLKFPVSEMTLLYYFHLYGVQKHQNY